MGCISSTGEFVQCRAQQDAFHKKYLLGKKLGEGSFGQVRLAKLRARQGGKRGEQRAVKIIDVRGFGETTDEPKLIEAKLEAAAMEKVGMHENCVRLIEYFESKFLFYIVMEKCDASLTEILEEAQIEEVDVARIFREMLLGIAHIHEAGLVHRDIKPSNFLLAGNGSGALGTVKLADFGIATSATRKGKALAGACGSAPYMSPEMVRGKPYGQKTDVWSFGVTAYVLLYGDFPYIPQEMNSRAMRKMIREGKPEPTFAPHPSSDIPPPSQSATNFVRSLLQRLPEERCTSEEALQLSFLSKVVEDGTVGGACGCPPKAAPKHIAKRNPESQARSFRTAVQRTQNIEAQLEEHERRKDPTVAHSLDELLMQLQGSPQRSFTHEFHKSGTCNLEATEPKKRVLDGLGDLRQSRIRSRTHHGGLLKLPLELQSVETPETDLPSTSTSAGTTGSSGSSGKWAHEKGVEMPHSTPKAALPCSPTGQFDDEALRCALNSYMQKEGKASRATHAARKLKKKMKH